MAYEDMPVVNFDFTGQTILITGAGAGNPKAIAFAFAHAGANLILNDINPDRVDSLLEELRAITPNVVGFDGDISNRFQVSALIERGRDAFGKVHALVHGATVYKSDALDRIDEWDLHRQIEVNLIGAIYCMQLMGRVMADEGGGAMVLLTSDYATRTLPSGLGYISTQAALQASMRQVARELAPKGVRVNSVVFGNIDDDDLPQTPHSPNMLNTHGTPNDIANATLFLCSDAAQFITAQALHVNGGEL
jgi:NAD(P)-dependent dehydrogenase (short-subunit alcohol dehydrogenase family)